MNESSELINEKMYSVGRVVVDRSLHTQSADEPFFRYFGNDVIYSIRRTIDEDDYPRIAEAVEDSDDGTVRRTVIRMKGITGEVRWIMAAVRRLPSAEDEEPLYSIAFSDVFSLERLAYSRQGVISDYRYILSLVNDLAFEYSFETKRIRIFMFDCYRDMILVDEELEKWRKQSIDEAMSSHGT